MPKSPASDPQREEVYRWEFKYRKTMWGDYGMVRLHKLKRLVCKEYGVKAPKLQTLDHPKFSGECDYDNGVVRMDPVNRTARVLLHELAHWTVDALSIRGPAHGPIWLGLYMRLMDRHHVLPLDASIPSASAAGLVFLSPTVCDLAGLREIVESQRPSL